MKYFNFLKVRAEHYRLEYLKALRDFQHTVKPRFLLFTLGSFSVSVLVGYHLIESSTLPTQTAFMAAIFVLAGLLWVTEALPLFATALVVIALEIILLANPGDWSWVGTGMSGQDIHYSEFLSPLSDPIIILFLGGFILAQAAVKVGIDRALASNVLKIFGSKPRTVMLGLMAITAIFSMWMSNTATTAMMITLTVPLLTQVESGDPFKKALVLCIPFAANIGGMGTPIASPPNAVTVAFLKDIGIEISFLQWTLVALPLVVVLLLITWMILWKVYQPKKDIVLKSEAHKINPQGYYVMFVFVATIGLWLSEGWHGLPTSVVAFFPIVAFTSTGIIRRSDINSLEWHILILIAGGLALGSGLKITNLDNYLVGLIPHNDTLIFPLLVTVTVLLSTFMSNTAAANLLIPLGVSYAVSTDDSGLALEIGIGIAFAASLAMSLPISTPPNAIAYAKGILHSKDFSKAGMLIGIIGITLIILIRLSMHWFSA